MPDLDHLRELFEHAVASSDSERGHLLARLRERDPDAADVLERMLDEDRLQEDTLLTPAPSEGAPNLELVMAIAGGRGFPDRRGAPLLRESSGTQLQLPADAPTVDGVRLEGVIGSGGLGRVYRGRDGDRVVAVKVPRTDRRDPNLLERWDEECRLAHALPLHPNLVTVHRLTTARFADGMSVPAMIMEYLPGALDLLTYADRHQLDRDGRLALFEQACRGVGHLHSRAVVHGDIKPSNLLTIETPEGPLVKVGDLGGTRTMIRHDSRPPQFTWVYASPEQIDDDPVKIGPQSDVYSLGKVLWALLCGAETVKLPSGTDRSAYATWEPPPLADRLGLGDTKLESRMRRAVARAPAQRHESAHDLRTDLARCDPPRVQRWLGAVGQWLNPAGEAATPTRTILRRAVLVLIVALLAGSASVVLCNGSVRAESPLHLFVPVPVPAAMEHVVIARLRDREEVRSLVAEHQLDQVDPSNVVTYRHLWAAVIARLAEAGAAVIALDIRFPERPDDPSLDDVILGAVTSARQQGTAVVVAVADLRTQNGPEVIAPKLVAAVDGFGQIRVEPALIGLGSAVITADRGGAAPRVPLALAATAAAGASPGDGGRVQVEVDAARRRILLRGPQPPAREVTIARFVRYHPEDPLCKELTLDNRIDMGDRLGFYIFDLPADAVMESAEITIADILDEEGLPRLRARVSDRIVVVANNSNPEPRFADYHAYTPASSWPYPTERTVPGSWFHAAAIESMMTGLRGPEIGVGNILSALTVAAIGAFTGWWLGGIRHRRSRKALPRREATRGTIVMSIIWGAVVVAIPATLAVLCLTVSARIPYPVAHGVLAAVLSVVLGLGLALRAAWGRRAQAANLREISHVW